MKKTSNTLLAIMKHEAEEERPSVDELIQQMEYKLNKSIALLENTIRCQILTLHVSEVFNPGRYGVFAMAIYNALAERKSIIMMPASQIFKKGGEHHKYTTEMIDGEEVILVKHPKRDKTIHPDHIHFHLA